MFVTLCYDSAARAESGADSAVGADSGPDDSDSECVMTACYCWGNNTYEALVTQHNVYKQTI